MLPVLLTSSVDAGKAYANSALIGDTEVKMQRQWRRASGLLPLTSNEMIFL